MNEPAPPPLEPEPDPYGAPSAPPAAPRATAPQNLAPSEGGSLEHREEGQAPSIPRRAVPDYDSRPDAPVSVEESLLWIPRVLFFPVHLFFEYVLRQPIGWFLTTMERESWHELFIDFFTWDERKAGLVPTAIYDFGFIPSVGLYFWWNDFLDEGNHLRAQVAFGGPDWLRATVSDRFDTSAETDMGFTVDALRRPDYVFEGIGWDSAVGDRSRFIRSYVEGRYDFWFRPWRASQIHFAAGVTWNDFQLQGYSPDADDQDVSLEQALAQGRYPEPAGLSGYTAYFQRLDVAIDTREERPAPGHGVRVEGYVDQGFDLTAALDRRWMRYGGAVGAFVDLGENRVLALHGHARFADPLETSQPVPFVELASLGGEALVMSGFLRGQLIGRSAASLTLEYRYPLWVFLDGSLHASVGNAFDAHLSDFDVERLRMSVGLGFRSIGDRDQSFNFLVAFGSAPFVDGLHIESVRLVIGSQQGF